jgi:hypothetical protein
MSGQEGYRLKMNWKALFVGAVIGAAAGWMGCKLQAKGGIKGVMSPRP